LQKNAPKVVMKDILIKKPKKDDELQLGEADNSPL
jgi:hypothetical protein